MNSTRGIRIYKQLVRVEFSYAKASKRKIKYSSLYLSKQPRIMHEARDLENHIIIRFYFSKFF